MLHSFRWVVALILCASLAYAGATGTKTDRAAVVPFSDAPASALDRATFPPLKGPTGPTVVGTYTSLAGYYDYQSNGGVNQYIRVDSVTGKIHVVYMLAEDSTAISPSRRTGYAVSANDGATWNNFSNVRVPFIRSGFPTLDITQDFREPLIANHNAPVLDPNTFVYIGDTTGLFTELTPLPPLTPPASGGEPIWPFVASAANGNVVLQASLSNTTTGDFENYIQKTPDLINWDVLWTQIPAQEGGGGRYPAAANGAGRVAFATRADTTFLTESTDNGATWTNTIIHLPTRVSGAETLGHWVGVDMVYLGDQPIVALNTSRTTDGSSFFFAGSRIEVWGPTLGFKTAAPWDSLLYPSSMVSQTNHLAVGYPAIGRSGNALVIAYQAFLNNDATADTASGGRLHGEIFVTQSLDGGNTWTIPVNITNTPQLDERYPSVSKWNPAGFAYITWQEDTRAGSAAFTDNAPVSLAKQVFYKAALNTLFPANDVTALAVTSPPPGSPLKVGQSFVPKAAYRNIGTANQTNVPVRFEVLSLTGTVLASSNTTIASILSGETQEATFTAVGGTLAPGNYRTRAYSLLVGDQKTSNDTTGSTFNVIPVITLGAGVTYSANFEGVTEGGSGWFGALTGGLGNSDWQLGTPAKTQLNGAHSGVNAWVTKLTGTYSDGQESYLGSPVFDLSAFSDSMQFEFWHNWKMEPNWDGGVLQYSIDGGTTWITHDQVLGTGGNFDSPLSTSWYNEDTDSSATDFGVPMWGDSSVIYASNVNGWVKSKTLLPVGGVSDVRIRFRWSADAAVNTEGWAIDDVSLGPKTATPGVPVTAGWNLVSSPVARAAGSDSVLQLYPTSLFSYAFRYDPPYAQSQTLANGVGYWAKFPAATTANIAGEPIFSFQIPVDTGWNMVGSITSPVTAAGVTSIPSGLRQGSFFRFANGYNPATTLTPGGGYWVKSSGDGVLVFIGETPGPVPPAQEAPALGEIFNSVSITDASGAVQTLYFGTDEGGAVDAAAYELPPAPPAGAFDARFVSGGLVGEHAGGTSVNLPIALQTDAYPVTVSWNVRNGSYTIGHAAGRKEMGSAGSLVITNPGVARLLISGSAGEAVPTEFALLQNYPNPFNPSTNVRFALPTASRVTVEIYNLLGQKLTTLLSQNLPAGVHSAEWNGTATGGQSVGSGVYFVRFAATGADGVSFSDTRKIMLMK